jgi:hypothetical protein
VEKGQLSVGAVDVTSVRWWEASEVSSAWYAAVDAAVLSRSVIRASFSMVGSPLPYWAMGSASRPVDEPAVVVVVVDPAVVVVVPVVEPEQDRAPQFVSAGLP